VYAIFDAGISLALLTNGESIRTNKNELMIVNFAGVGKESQFFMELKVISIWIKITTIYQFAVLN
jgi:hypothetical protein